MAVTLEAEFRANHEKFKPAVLSETAAVQQSLLSNDATFLESYKLVCAFRGWHEIVLQDVSEQVVGFFIEAHNDLLTSHVLAMSGMWRSSLISLRAFMESYLAFVFFRDHPIELRQWSEGDFRLEPKNLRQYCVKHPDVGAYPIALSTAMKLDGEYSKLSGSVHGTRTDFRMTAASSYPAISTADVMRLKKWIKLERNVVRTSLVLLLALNSKSLKGAAHPVFRRVIGACLSSAVKSSIRQQMSITV